MYQLDVEMTIPDNAVDVVLSTQGLKLLWTRGMATSLPKP